MIIIKHLQLADVPAAKQIADQNRQALGFMSSAYFKSAVDRKSGLVAVLNDRIIGFTLYNHRKRDKQTTLYSISVDTIQRGLGVGKQMLKVLADECQRMEREYIQLKCPTDLPANTFYKRFGFELVGQEASKLRQLNIWRLYISTHNRKEQPPCIT